jgi:hypothetical protein
LAPHWGTNLAKIQIEAPELPAPELTAKLEKGSENVDEY